MSAQSRHSFCSGRVETRFSTGRSSQVLSGQHLRDERRDSASVRQYTDGDESNRLSLGLPHDELMSKLAHFVTEQEAEKNNSIEPVFAPDMGVNHVNASPPLSENNDEKLRQIRSSLGQSNENLNSILWTAFAICIPISLVSAALLAVVFSYQVEPQTNLFQSANTTNHSMEQLYILVDFSATQIAFLASFLSTVAPLLTGCVMSLVAMLICRDLMNSSELEEFSLLPSPYQMSLLVGILSASYEQLISSMGYLLSSKRRTKSPPVLIQAATILLLSVLLGMAVTAADAVLHYYTTTVTFDMYSTPPDSGLEFGRGLNAYCANFNRFETNNGYPCTIPTSLQTDDPNFLVERVEVQNLAFNTSSASEIRHGLPNQDSEQDIAFLIPKPATLPPGVDYQVTTFGVSSQCQLMSAENCNVTSWGQYDGTYTNFSCSKAFWGTLGTSPAPADTDNIREPSPSLPFLGVKPQATLQYGYFSDSDLQTVYNPLGLNDSAIPDPNIKPLSDQQLLNPIYMAFAWRTAEASFAFGIDNEMANTPEVKNYGNDSNWLDYFLNCRITTYEVTYVWFNGTIQSLTAIPHKNGTMLNMWQSMESYGSAVTEKIRWYQNFNVQAAIAGKTTSSYEQRFSQLLSEPVLATLGGYSSPRKVLQQQMRETILVAKVPKIALGALLGCSLIYPVLGLILAFKSYSSERNCAKMRGLLSYWGLAAAAWHDDRRLSRIVTPDQIKACGQEENTRLFVRGDSEKGFQFGVWERASSGDVVEIHRSQTDSTLEGSSKV